MGKLARKNGLGSLWRGLVALLIGVTLALSLVLGLSAWAFSQAQTWLEEELLEARAGRFQEADSLHLLFVGDSFTAGEMSESGIGYSGYVQEPLAKLFPSRRVETVNIALAGSTTETHLAQLNAFLAESKQRVDGVVLISGVNNWDSLHYQRRYVREVGIVPWWIQILYQGPSSLLFALHYPLSRMGIGEVGDPQQVMLDPLKAFWHEDEGYEHWLEEETRKGLAAVEAQCDAMGARLWLGSYIAHSMSEILRAYASDRSLPFFDTQGAAVELAYRKAGFFAEDDWHLNDQGNLDLGRRWAGWFAAQQEPTRRPIEAGSVNPQSADKLGSHPAP